MTLNDIGLSLEIIGFVVFLFIPIRETFNLIINTDDKKPLEKVSQKMDNNKVRGIGIGLVFIGLALQYDWIMVLVDSMLSVMASYPT